MRWIRRRAPDADTPPPAAAAHHTPRPTFSPARSESVPNIKAAQAAGLTAGAYLFPCAGKPAADQVKATVAGLSGVHIDRLWFDIETNPSTGCGWSSDHATNCAFMGELLSAGKSLGVTMGIYASEYMWSGIMGSDCTVGASYALWYAHYDNNPSFSDFTSFGGWHTPYAKQYNDNGSACSASYDKNWMP